MTKPPNPRQEFSTLIIRIFLIGAGLMLFFYATFFRLSVMKTENMVIERRMNLVAPHHFQLYQQGQIGPIVIDPLLTLFDRYDDLPPMVKSKVKSDWVGSTHMTFDDDTELQLLSAQIDTPSGAKIVYALENSDAVEWSDSNFLLFELILLASGMLLFLLVCLYIIKTVKRITTPLNDVAMKLAKADAEDFSPFHINLDSTFEFARVVGAINAYKAKQAELLKREQSFTRYISHELRTPMTIIRGALSNLRRQAIDSKYLDKIDDASEQMASLTNTFLLLSRDGQIDAEKTLIDDEFLAQIQEELQDKITANDVEFYWQLQRPFTLNAHPVLLKVTLQNLLLNAINCAFQGKVVALVDSHQINVVDNGIGLGDKPRGYEGFGIGLVLVRDICDRYGWRFELGDNPQGGCTATIVFTPQGVTGSR